MLASYADERGRRRELIALPGNAGSRLVVDRDAATLCDRRLLAHLAADEPPENARIVCDLYLADPSKRCRRMRPDDLRVPALAAAPGASTEHDEKTDADGAGSTRRADNPDGGRPVDGECSDDPVGERPDGECLGDEDPDHDRPDGEGLDDRDGVRTVRRGAWSYSLRPVSERRQGTQLCWCRGRVRDDCGRRGGFRRVRLRDIVATFEAYEPVRALTASAIASHAGDSHVAVTQLSEEYERLCASPIVLNRGLREAVTRAVEQGTSLSEIALRCGFLKRDRNGKVSGETSWLARRVGMMPEGGERRPTPWVHSDVLAVVARAGLGMSPRDVEVD